MTPPKTPSSLVLQLDGGETAPQSNDEVNQWIATTINTGLDGKLLEPNSNYTEHLYELLLKTLQDFYSFLQRDLQASSLDAERLKESLTRFFLWGREFRGGRLTLILSNAEELEGNVRNSLEHIGRLLLTQYDQTKRSDRSSFVEDLRDLLKPDRHSDSSSKNEPCFDKISRALLADDFASSAEERNAWHHGNHDPDSDCQSLDSISTYDEDICISLQNEVDNLMDLLPAIEQSYAHLQLSCANPARSRKHREFSVTPAALPFVRNVAAKFENADTILVQRLGESNWQRFMMIRARKGQTSDASEEVAQSIPPLPLSDVFEAEEMPKSIFVAQTLFYDSGLGISAPSTPSRAQSNASHSSFLSGLLVDGERPLRVPKTPTAVSLGKEFNCEICGNKLSTIRNRIDWKRHVFEDLQPYICTFPDCEKYLVKFATRSRWAEHEFNDHRCLRAWKCPECTEETATPAELESHLRKSHLTSRTRLISLSLLLPLLKPKPLRSNSKSVLYAGVSQESPNEISSPI